MYWLNNAGASYGWKYRITPWLQEFTSWWMELKHQPLGHRVGKITARLSGCPDLELAFDTWRNVTWAEAWERTGQYFIGSCMSRRKGGDKEKEAWPRSQGSTARLSLFPVTGKAEGDHCSKALNAKQHFEHLWKPSQLSKQGNGIWWNCITKLFFIGACMRVLCQACRIWPY